MMPGGTKAAYDASLCAAIAHAVEITTTDELVRMVRAHLAMPAPAPTSGATAVATASGNSPDVRLRYRGLTELTQVLSQLQLMTDHKAGVPRGSYLGVLPFAMGARTVYLYPFDLTSTWCVNK